MKRIESLVLLFAVSSLLYACKVGQTYEKPQGPWNRDSTVALAVDSTPPPLWSTLVSDPVLRQLIQNTLDSNRNLLLATKRIEEARLNTDVIRANQYPLFSYQAQGGGGSAGTAAQKVAGGINGGLMNVFGVLNWELDLWGRLRRSTASAQAQYLSTEQNKNQLRVSLVAEVASAYFLLRDLDNRLLIAQKTLASRKENTRILTERYNKGYIAELDRFQAVQQEAQAAALIPNLKRQIVQTENAICLLMGKMPSPVPRGETIAALNLQVKVPAGLSTGLLLRRPDIQAAEFQLQAQFERIGIAQASLYPRLSLTGVLGFASPQLSTLISNGFVANGFANLVGPLFQYGQNRNRVEIEKRRTEQVQLQYEQTVLGAFAEVKNALVAVQTFEEEYSQRRIQAEAGRKALELSQARYNFGYTSYLEVLVQENSLFDAELQESILKQQRLNSIIGLYRSLGGGWN